VSKTRKLAAFLIYAAMIGGGFYLLTSLSIHNKGGAVAGATAIFLMGLGGYLLWVDIIGPALGIKTPEEAREKSLANCKTRCLVNRRLRHNLRAIDRGSIK
jgi:hypothetical protein